MSMINNGMSLPELDQRPWIERCPFSQRSQVRHLLYHLYIRTLYNERKIISKFILSGLFSEMPWR
ncbi:hypothetical protein WG66_004536 [Moniliophthora roreri]|nr:hypothetical protein WG66_004536 [Moniliophthora roreri]